MSSSMESRISMPAFELPAQLDASAFAEYLAALDRSLDALQPFAMIVDGSKVAGGLEQAPRGAWHRIRTTRLTAFCKGLAIVTGTGKSAERIRVLCTLQPPMIPYAFFSDLEEARSWARGQLEGVPVEQHNRHKTVSLMSVSGL